jgi:hypothetical protein
MHVGGLMGYRTHLLCEQNWDPDPGTVGLSGDCLISSQLACHAEMVKVKKGKSSGVYSSHKQCQGKSGRYTEDGICPSPSRRIGGIESSFATSLKSLSQRSELSDLGACRLSALP